MRGIFLLVVLKPGPMKGTVYAGRKSSQPPGGLLQQGFCWHSWEARGKKKKEILTDTAKSAKCRSVARGFPVQVL